MDQTPESSQSPLDKAMIEGENVNALPATSSCRGMPVATPAAYLAAIQSSSHKAKTGGKTSTTPPKTPFSGNTEFNTGKLAHCLLVPSSPASDRNTPLLPSSLEVFASVVAAAPCAVAQRPGIYTHQFPTSSTRTTIERKCGRCVTGCGFKTFSQSVCDDCIENGHGSPDDISIFRARLLEENDQFPFPRLDNATTGNPATGGAAIDDDSGSMMSYDSDATIPMVY